MKRSDRINHIKQKISEGLYHVSASKLADKILEKNPTLRETIPKTKKKGKHYTK